jgi:hypothetical protein
MTSYFRCREAPSMLKATNLPPSLHGRYHRDYLAREITPRPGASDDMDSGDGVRGRVPCGQVPGVTPARVCAGSSPR